MKNVAYKNIKRCMVVALTASFGYAATGAYAAQVESPPVASASAILGGQVRGSNYHIDNTVRGDEFLQIFELDTNT